MNNIDSEKHNSEQHVQRLCMSLSDVMMSCRMRAVCTQLRRGSQQLHMHKKQDQYLLRFEMYVMHLLMIDVR